MRSISTFVLVALCTSAESLVRLPSSRARAPTRVFAGSSTSSKKQQRRSKYYSSSYTRDPRDEGLEDRLDSELHNMLQERARARQERNWEKADRILKQLQRAHNIQVYDGFKRVYSRQNSVPLVVLKERYEKLHGPNCHPYTHVGPQTLDPVACPLTMNDVHNVLSRRQWLKSEKRFFEADAQLYELMTYGIEVNDSARQWRSDGKVLFQKEWSKPPTQALSYREITSLTLLERSRVRIRQLMKQRSYALARNDLNLVSALGYELYKAYDVHVNDMDLVWQVGGDGDPVTFQVTAPYATISTSHLPTLAALDPEHNWAMGVPYRYNEIVSTGPLSDGEESRVHHLLMVRDELRSIGHFAEADAIALELWRAYAVDPHDAKRQYAVGKKFEAYGVEQQASTTKKESAVGKNGRQEPPKWWEVYEESEVAKELGPSKASEVENLIKYLATQQQRNPNIVDRLMVRLEEEYNLVFDGKTWKLKGKIQQYAPANTPSFSSEEMETIQHLVDKRNEEMFSLKNKSMAEILEAGLKSKYHILIDDDTQTWHQA